MKFESLISLNFPLNLWHPIQLSSNLTTHSSLFHILMHSLFYHHIYALIIIELHFGAFCPLFIVFLFFFLSIDFFLFFFFCFSYFVFFLYTRNSMHKVLHLINTWVCTQFPIFPIIIQNYPFIHPMSQDSHTWMILTHSSLS